MPSGIKTHWEASFGVQSLSPHRKYHPRPVLVPEEPRVIGSCSLLLEWRSSMRSENRNVGGAGRLPPMHLSRKSVRVTSDLAGTTLNPHIASLAVALPSNYSISFPQVARRLRFLHASTL